MKKYTLTEEELDILVVKLEDKIYFKLSKRGYNDIASSLSESAKNTVKDFIEKREQ